MVVEWNQVKEILERQVSQVEDTVLSEGQREVSAWLAKKVGVQAS